MMQDQAEPSRDRRNRVAFLLLGVGSGAIVAVIVFIALILTGVVSDGNDYSGPDTPVGFGSLNNALTPVAPPAAEVNTSPVTNISFPEYGKNAPVIVLGLDEKGVMESPDGPSDAAWYDFSAHPGSGSNAVFSGHVDWTYDGDPGPAVFWHLKDMQAGDIVEVKLEDGTVYKYAVDTVVTVDPDTVDVPSIVGPTPKEIVTLITCGGTFDQSVGHYQSRVIVRAERVDAPASASR